MPAPVEIVVAVSWPVIMQHSPYSQNSAATGKTLILKSVQPASVALHWPQQNEVESLVPDPADKNYSKSSLSLYRPLGHSIHIIV